MINYIKILFNKFTLIHVSKYLAIKFEKLRIFFNMVNREKLTYSTLIKMFWDFNKETIFRIIQKITNMILWVLLLTYIIRFFNFNINDYHLFILTLITSYYNFITNIFNNHYNLMLEEFKNYYKEEVEDIIVEEVDLIPSQDDNQKIEDVKKYLKDYDLKEDSKTYWDNPYIKWGLIISFLIIGGGVIYYFRDDISQLFKHNDEIIKPKIEDLDTTNCNTPNFSKESYEDYFNRRITEKLNKYLPETNTPEVRTSPNGSWFTEGNSPSSSTVTPNSTCATPSETVRPLTSTPVEINDQITKRGVRSIVKTNFISLKVVEIILKTFFG